jgi:hypothetical protein
VVTPIKRADRCVRTGDEREQCRLHALKLYHRVERVFDQALKVDA